MRSEREIREHRDALRLLLKVPCDCAAQGHDYECQMGGLLMAAQERILSWALGEAGDQGAVDHLNEAAAKVRARGKKG